MKNRMLGAFALCAAVFVANEARAASAYEVFEVHNVTELTNACIAANSNYNKILMYPGVYDLTGIKMGSNTHLTMKGLNSGLWAGLGEKPEDTIVKGSGPIDVCRIISFDKACTVSNLTFTGAYYDYKNCSGGVTGSGNAFFTDCVFSNNYAQNFGGALDGTKHLVRCKFIGNWSGSCGGVMRPWTSGRSVYEDCYFEGNHSPKGGVAYYGATWLRCVFVGNYANNNGVTSAQGGYGNIFVDCAFTNNHVVEAASVFDSATAATNCIFYGNYSGVYGQSGTTMIASCPSVYGCELTSNTGMPMVTSCTLRNCTMVGNLGHRINTNPVFSGCKMYNCLIAGTEGGKHGMAPIVSGSSLYNCTVVSNFHHTVNGYDQHGVVDGGVAVNTIFSGNMTPNGSAWKPWDFAKSGFPVMTNCIWSAMLGTAAKDASVNPQVLPFEKIRFTDPANGDYTLQRKSPAKDAGYQDDDYLAEVGPDDLNGDPRVYEGDGPAKAIIDIGCYECQIPAPGLMMLVK